MAQLHHTWMVIHLRSKRYIVKNNLLNSSSHVDYIAKLFNQLSRLDGSKSKKNDNSIHIHCVLYNIAYQSVVSNGKTLKKLVVPECAQNWKEISALE